MLLKISRIPINSVVKKLTGEPFREVCEKKRAFSLHFFVLKSLLNVGFP